MRVHEARQDKRIIDLIFSRQLRSVTMVPATTFISCLLLIAVASVQCADVPADGAELPGRNISPGNQCRTHKPRGYGGVCMTADPATRCSELNCAETEDYDIPVPREVGPALDGTWCGDKKICFKGACINDPQPPASPLKITDFQYGCEKWWG